jgi:hypothetical protein
MDVLTLVSRWFTRRSDEALVVQSESPNMLTLRHGRQLSTFDRLSRTITQQGKVVAPFGTVRHIRVFDEPSAAGTVAWWITLQLAGTGSVRVGSCAERADAAQLAGQISAVTGAPVLFGQPTLL